ncbi:hypothetical protein, partial [Acinetobacter baumannii]|uniref:hypothetical protein n=1 Tax=Acinetobacter baumannii TaxID=470 RepID=UPI003394125D
IEDWIGDYSSNCIITINMVCFFSFKLYSSRIPTFKELSKVFTDELVQFHDLSIGSCIKGFKALYID